MERYFVLVFMLMWSTSFAADQDFCQRGFQIATRYHDCWQQAIFVNKYPDLYERHDQLDANFLGRYATHMCSVVKPQALGCFKKDVSSCANRDKLISIANDSGGACKGNALNPFFKQHVLNHLVPVTGDRESPCFTIGDKSYSQCYIAAGKKILESGKSDAIETFHVVADMFFNTYWDCLIDVFKSQAKLCPDWQIPMLLVLQKNALPSLFGMHLKPNQVYKLELETMTPLGIKDVNTTSGNNKGDEKEQEDKKVYLLMQVLTKKPTVASGGSSLVVELSNINSDKPILSLEGVESKESDREITEFIQILSGPNTMGRLKERRRKRKMEQRKRKQLENLRGKLSGKDRKPTPKKNRKYKPKPRKTKKKKVQNDSPNDDIYDKMISK